MIAYIDAHRDRFGVEPICSALQFAPRTYWAAKARPPCARARRDEALKPEIVRVHAENFGVYGAEKVWAQLNREGHRVARCTIERLMRDLGLRGAVRGKKHRTTIADETAARPAGSRGSGLHRGGTEPAVGRGPDVCADLVGVRLCPFITDVYSRMIVGWQASRSLRTDLALDALEQAIWSRQRVGQDLSQLVHHSERVVQRVRYGGRNTSMWKRSQGMLCRLRSLRGWSPCRRSRRYPPELRERRCGWCSSISTSIRRSGRRSSRSREDRDDVVRRCGVWVRQVEVDVGFRPGVTTTEAARIKELEREVRNCVERTRS